MTSLGFFTRASEEDRRWIKGEKTKEERSGAVLTGEEARDFYQSLFEEESVSGQKERKQDRRRRGGRSREGGPYRRSLRGTAAPPSVRQGSVSERDGHRLLRSAQDGDLRTLSDLLDRGCDVNFRDGFYWTPLMCASHAGQREAVRLLLSRQAAWVGVVDTQGRDARSLALQAGHQGVVRELDQFGITESSDRAADGTHSSRPRWCELCEVSYTDRAHTHTASTLHQFSLKRPPAAPRYCLPESSVSYRMMLRSGWDPCSGLGPSHSGRKQPVGTVLKRDQLGLGYGPPRTSKVTHFRSKDPQAVRRTEPKERVEKRASLSLKEVKRREEREKRQEIDFRNSFNMDV